MGVPSTMSTPATSSTGPSASSCAMPSSLTAESPMGLGRKGERVAKTPIYDIKPYLPFADCRPEASGGFAEEVKDARLAVVFPPELRKLIPEAAREALLEVLAQDPRPSYQEDPARRYGLPFAGFDVRFTVRQGVLTVCEVAPFEG